MGAPFFFEGNTMPIPLSYVALAGQIADISTAETIYFTSPIDGWIQSAQITLSNATSAGDAEISIEVGGAERGAVTIPPSTAGATFEVPFARVPVRKGGLIAVETDGGSTGTGAAAVTILLSP